MLALCILALALNDGFVDTNNGRACGDSSEETKNHFCFLEVISGSVPDNNLGSCRNGSMVMVMVWELNWFCAS